MQLAKSDSGFVTVNSSYLDGANVNLLNQLSSDGGFALSFDVVRLPRAVVAQADQSVWVAYTLGTLKYDCIASSVMLDVGLLPVAQFLHPHQPFAFSVVADGSVLAPRKLADVLFSWTKPFMATIWVVIVVSLIATSVIMFSFEGHVDNDDFGLVEYNLFVKLARGVNRSFSNFTCIGSFSPSTPAGQTYGVAFSFAMLLIQSAYTANLAAFFSKGSSPITLVTDAASFSVIGQAACMYGDPLGTELMLNNFPGVSLVILNASTHSLMEAMMAGQCAGVIATDVRRRTKLPLTPSTRVLWFCFTQHVPRAGERQLRTGLGRPERPLLRLGAGRVGAEHGPDRARVFPVHGCQRDGGDEQPGESLHHTGRLLAL